MTAPPLVQLLPTCLANELRPNVAWAAVRLLEGLGCRVEVPLEVVCCGQPAINAGFVDEALRVARHDVAVLQRTGGPIVVPSGSCADAIVHRWGELATDAGDEALAADVAAIAERTSELSTFLAEHQDVLPRARPPRGEDGGFDSGGGDGRDRGERRPLRVAYHPSCHLLRGLSVDTAPRALLETAPAVELVPLVDDDACCGFGGLFAVDQAPISEAMMNAKLDAVEASGADVLTACDLGCLVHLEGGLRRRGDDAGRLRVLHLAELLADGLDEGA